MAFGRARLRNQYALTDTLTGLAPRTYSVGMCGQLTSTVGSWNRQDWAYTTAQVFDASASILN